MLINKLPLLTLGLFPSLPGSSFLMFILSVTKKINETNGSKDEGRYYNYVMIPDAVFIMLIVIIHAKSCGA